MANRVRDKQAFDILQSRAKQQPKRFSSTVNSGRQGNAESVRACGRAMLGKRNAYEQRPSKRMLNKLLIIGTLEVSGRHNG